ncbi:MAG: hypothetical protein ACRC8K_08575 [Waterburya sp.]
MSENFAQISINRDRRRRGCANREAWAMPNRTINTRLGFSSENFSKLSNCA